MKSYKISPKLRKFNSYLETFGYNLGRHNWEISYSEDKAVFKKTTAESILKAELEVKHYGNNFKIKYIVSHPSEGEIMGGSFTREGPYLASRCLSLLTSRTIEPLFSGCTDDKDLKYIFNKYKVKESRK